MLKQATMIVRNIGGRMDLKDAAVNVESIVMIKSSDIFSYLEPAVEITFTNGEKHSFCGRVTDFILPAG